MPIEIPEEREVKRKHASMPEPFKDPADEFKSGNAGSVAVYVFVISVIAIIDFIGDMNFATFAIVMIVCLGVTYFLRLLWKRSRTKLLRKHKKALAEFRDQYAEDPDLWRAEEEVIRWKRTKKKNYVTVVFGLIIIVLIGLGFVLWNHKAVIWGFAVLTVLLLGIIRNSM